MNRVLIVDDEAMIRDGLKIFPWNKYDCELVGEADNGDDALLLIQQLEPDIVFTDIRMPGLDGLTLAAEIEKQFADTAVVLLSGYDDFSYAQKALQLSVSDYILKPADFAVIGATLEKLLESIQSRRTREEYYRKMERQMIENLTFHRARLFSELIGGSHLGEEEAWKRVESFGISKAAFVVVSAKGTFSHAEFQETRQSQLFELSIENLCHDLFNESFLMVISCKNRMRLHHVLVFDDREEDSRCAATAFHACQQVQEAVKAQLGAEISFGISNPTRRLTKLHYAGNEANQALDQRFFLGEDAVILYSDLNMQKGLPQGLSQGTIDYLHSMIYAGNSTKIRDFFEQLQTNDYAEQSGDITQFRKMIIELVLRVVWMMNSQGDARTGKSLSEFDFIQQAMLCPTQEQLLNLAEQTICELVEASKAEFGTRITGVASEIVQYINDHHMDDLSLDMLSEHFQLSSSYISRLLRHKTGKSFMEILFNLRMEHAKRLLKSGKYKVNEVAEQVGYHDLSYFIQMFKKRYGLTPNQYKLNEHR